MNVIITTGPRTHDRIDVNFDEGGCTFTVTQGPEPGVLTLSIHSQNGMSTTIMGPVMNIAVAPHTATATTTPRILPSDVGYKLFVRTLTGKSFVIAAESSWTVLKLKEALERVEGIPTDQQRLVFSGKQLEEQRTLASYNIPKDSTLHLILRLRGS